MGSLDPDLTTDNRLGVWALTDRQKVSQGGMPKLSSVVIGSETMVCRPLPSRRDHRAPLTPVMTACSKCSSWWSPVGRARYGTHPAGRSTERAGAAWFEVTPQLKNKKIGGATVAAQGYVASRGNYLLYPAIQSNGQGSATIVMTLTGAGTFPSAVYTMLQDDQHRFGGIHVAARGTGPYDPNATRWGDYSWAALDPSQGSFWLATEYIPPKSSQTADGVGTGARACSRCRRVIGSLAG